MHGGGVAGPVLHLGIPRSPEEDATHPAVAIAAALLLACGGGELTVEAACSQAWRDTTATLAALHASAGRPAPVLPDRETWLATCESSGLTAAQVACLFHPPPREPAEACGVGPEARAALDAPFLALE